MEFLMVQDDKKFIQLKKVVTDLLAGMEEIDTSSFSQAEKDIWELMLSKKKVFFTELEKFIYSIAGDLKKTRKELKKSSNKLLTQASEQLDKVTESTQKVADSVMNRIDNISEKQNGVFEQLNAIREKIKALNCEDTARSVTGFTNQIEVLENEIQMEAFEIMNDMQFQDITSQQIQQASNLIGEAENKLLDFGQILAVFSGEKGKQPQSHSNGLVFDPQATLEDREKRQALADEITTKFDKKK